MDDPARVRLVPFQIDDLCVKQRVVVEAELRADAAAMRENFRRMRVFLGRHMPGFLEQRHVDHRGRIALRAGIAVPVPGAAEIAALLDDADILDAGFGQPRGGGKPGKAAADEGEGDVVGLGIARRDRRIGIVEIMGELTLDLDILVVAVGAQPLVALLRVFPAQFFLVDGLVALFCGSSVIVISASWESSNVHDGCAARYGESAIDHVGIGSIRKIWRKCTSSGPSPIRNRRPHASA